uniref:Wsv293 n=1 Tax=Ascaris lumbricoides TaxID=6252 RepID=A0A0M3IMT8_ASCLU
MSVIEDLGLFFLPHLPPPLTLSAISLLSFFTVPMIDRVRLLSHFLSIIICLCKSICCLSVKIEICFFFRR